MDDETSRFLAYLEEAQHDPDIHGLLTDIFGERTGKGENIVCFSLAEDGFGLLLFFAAPVLYRWAIDTLNHRRAKQELDIARQQIDLMMSLTKCGLPQEATERLVKSCLEATAKRNADDPALTKMLALAEKARVDLLGDNTP